MGGRLIHRIDLYTGKYGNGEVTERLVCYIQCEGCTGREVCDEIVQALSNLGLNPQMYDGAGAMSGCHNGCAKLFRDVSPRAVISIVQATS